MTVGRSTSPTHQVGQKAEEAALLFLQQQISIVEWVK
jgi:hypothetical protein